MLGTLVLSSIALHTPPMYIRLRLHELAALADRVVTGRIEALQDGTFDFLVEDTLVGAPGATLRLRRFVDWTCAGRYAPYAVGQELLLFLKEDRALGAGNEGEMPLLGEGVLVPYAVRGSRLVERAVHGDSIGASWVPLADVASVLADYRASFAFQPGEPFGHAMGKTRPTVSADELSALQARSAFARELVEDTLRCPCVHGYERASSETSPDGTLSARALELDRTLTWVLEDGVELRSSFGGALAAVPNRAGSDVLAAAGVSWDRCLVRLRGRGGSRPDSVVRLGPGELGITKAEDLYRGPTFGAAVALLDDRDPLVLAVGAPDSYHGRKTEDHTGSVHVVTWPTSSEPELRHSIQPGTAPAGLIDGCAFGRALCALGDLDRDGQGELVVGRRPDREWGTKERHPGSLAVLFLDGSGSVSRWTPIAPQDVGFDSPDDFGLVLAAPGDLDGDRVPDLVLGEPLDRAAGTYRGALRVLFLTPAGKVRDWRRIDATSEPALALEPGDELGAALAAPGDLDGDGVPDLVASGSRALWSLSLRPDGSLKRAHRLSLAALFPTAVEPLSLASAGGDGHVLLAASFGVEKPRDVGLARLHVDAAGTWTVVRH